MGPPKIKVLKHLNQEAPMRPPHYTITPAVVRSSASKALRNALPWKPYGRSVSASRLLELMLLVAALRCSLSAVVKRFRFGLSHETAREIQGLIHSLAPRLQPG